MSVFPIPSGRVSSQQIRAQLLFQTQANQSQLLRLQTQAATGLRLNRPSDDPLVTSRALTLQRLQERREQTVTNLRFNRTGLSVSSTSISHVSDLLNGIRGTVVTAIDSSSNPLAREVSIREISQTLSELLTIGNREVGGRFLFGGSPNGVTPLEFQGEYIRYAADDKAGSNYVDLDLLNEFGVDGNSVFGTLSRPVGGLDLQPAATLQTRVSDIAELAGARLGQIEVSDGTNSSIVDLSGVETLGDVAKRLEAFPPPGREVTVAVVGERLQIELDQFGVGNISIREVDGGTTAARLGLDGPSFDRTLLGEPLTRLISRTTSIDDLFGGHAQAVISATGNTGKLTFRAKERGDALNGFSVHLVDDGALQAGPGITAGNEYGRLESVATAAQTAITFGDAAVAQNDILLTSLVPGSEYNDVEIVLERQTGIGTGTPQVAYTNDGIQKRLTLTLDDAGATPITAITAAVNALQVNGQQIFQATNDNSGGGGNGTGVVPTAITAGVIGNTGNTGGEANTIFLHLAAGHSTADDLVAAVENDLVLSELFEVTSSQPNIIDNVEVGRSGFDFSAVGAFGGGTGKDPDLLSGVRIVNAGEAHVISLADAENVEDILNAFNSSPANVFAEISPNGKGIHVRSRLSGGDLSIGENGGTTASDLGVRSLTADTPLSELNFGRGVDSIDGTDFTIRRNDGVELEIDISTATNVQDVLDLINNHLDNQDPTVAVVARLAAVGNGIELVNDNPAGLQTLTVLKSVISNAAVDLGLVAFGDVEAIPAGPPASPASFTFKFGQANNDLIVESTEIGPEFNGIDIEIVNTAAVGDQALVTFDGINKTLTIDVDPTATTANTVVAALNAEAEFSAALDLSVEPTNDGTGLIDLAGFFGVTAGGAANPTANPAALNLSFPNPNDVNTALLIESVQLGTTLNEIDVIFADTVAAGSENVVFDGIGRTLTINYDAGASTANQVIAAIIAEGTFNAELDLTDDLTNDGTGVINSIGSVGLTAGGTPETLTARDVNAIEVDGIFNTLIKLQQSLEDDNFAESARTINLLDDDLGRISFARADLGAREASMDALERRLQDEDVQTQEALSNELDVDLVTVISDLQAEQVALEASLRLTSQALQLTLLDFI